jgi:hypothetical protein
MRFTYLWLSFGHSGVSLAELKFEDDELFDVKPQRLEVRAVNGEVVTGVLAVMKALGGPATSLCSSYLHTPATTTVTITTTGPAANVWHSV